MTEFETNNKQHELIHFERVFGMLLIIFCILVFFNSDYFSIRTVNVTGAHYLSKTEIVLAAGIRTSQNIWLLDDRSIKKRLLADSRLAEVVIERHFPDGVLLKVSEREPCCWIVYQDNSILISESGVPINAVDAGDLNSLPQVIGVRPKKLQYGVPIQDSNFALALKILESADPILRKSFSIIDVKNYRIELSLLDRVAPIQVDLGDAEQLPKKLFNLKAIITTVPAAKLSRIDLRTPDLPTVLKNVEKQ
jgi:cell division septal protein FtsQ